MTPQRRLRESMCRKGWPENGGEGQSAFPDMGGLLSLHLRNRPPGMDSTILPREWEVRFNSAIIRSNCEDEISARFVTVSDRVVPQPRTTRKAEMGD